MALPRRILIIDDDAAVRETLLEQLAIDGEFAPAAADCAKAASAMLEGENARFDAIVLDIGLPDADGREYCAQLRRGGISIPIITRPWPTRKCPAPVRARSSACSPKAISSANACCAPPW